MSVWLAIPSIRPRAEVEPILKLWIERGYKIALLRQGEPIGGLDLEIPTGEYLGWARSTNIMAKRIMEEDPEMTFTVGGGDDYEPDLAHTAEEIAEVLCETFGDPAITFTGSADRREVHPTFGVMQPTGDRWGDDPAARAHWGADRGAYIDRICGSPWMGREWCRRAYQGNGPMFAGYHHFYADEELQEVSARLGVLWQRRDLTQTHRHWGRKPGGADEEDVPAWYRERVSPDWGPAGALFAERKAAGFPGSDPL